jgi:DNA (cytosine-5)-methyltransferase 1
MVPSILCLNDQGGQVMECSENISGTLRAQEHGHQPLVFENHGIDARYRQLDGVAPTMSARYGTGGNNVPLVASEPESKPMVFDNHGQDSRFQGPTSVAQTVSASFGEGGNNTSLVVQGEEKPAVHHTFFNRQRVDVFREEDVASTQSARQHKDATDLVYQDTVGALTSSDRKGPNSQYVSQDKCVIDTPRLIRRLTPLECERLQGYPDGWTDLPGASDSARYKALGNSVAIPCVEFVMRGLALAAQYM